MKIEKMLGIATIGIGIAGCSGNSEMQMPAKKPQITQTEITDQEIISACLPERIACVKRALVENKAPYYSKEQRKVCDEVLQSCKVELNSIREKVAHAQLPVLFDRNDKSSNNISANLRRKTDIWVDLSEVIGRERANYFDNFCSNNHPAVVECKKTKDDFIKGLGEKLDTKYSRCMAKKPKEDLFLPRECFETEPETEHDLALTLLQNDCRTLITGCMSKTLSEVYRYRLNHLAQ
ncbi:hypothetical protein IT412_04720 [Candidatus Peregrinibacteria bacterium]|nr:hypothetical protein [Candidatus Peregrinibacteria bacterium]